nr:plant cysteine oxidase 3 [Ipomoea batatas]
MNAKSSSIQALYDLSKKTFTPSVTLQPSPQAIHKLSSLLDTIGPEDVGLKDESQEDERGHGLFGINVFNRVDRWAQPITYVDIYEGQSFTVTPLARCAYFASPLPRLFLCMITPGMTVLSKVLYGSLHVKGYDWVEPPCIRKSEQTGQPAVRLAKLSVDRVVTAPCGPSVLYPKSGGNLHCFTAVTPCAVLDILAPPYDEAAGRRCTYYHDYPYSSFGAGNEDAIVNGKEDEYAWLTATDTPDNLYMRSGRLEIPSCQNLHLRRNPSMFPSKIVGKSCYWAVY